MTSLTLRYPVIVYDPRVQDTPFEALSKEEQIVAMQLECKEISATLAGINSRIQKMSSAVSLQCASMQAQMRELELELEELELEKQRRLKALHAQEGVEYDADDLYDAAEDLNNRFEEALREAQEVAHESSKPNPQLLKLYRKIAMLCHPDRTNDTYKHQLFIQAKEYFRDKNLEGLQRIFDMLQGKSVSSLFQKLIKKFQDTLYELTSLRKSLKALMDSEDYDILQAYEKRPDIVVRALQERLMVQTAMLANRKHALQVELGLVQSTPSDVFQTVIFTFRG